MGGTGHTEAPRRWVISEQISVIPLDAFPLPRRHLEKDVCVLSLSPSIPHRSRLDPTSVDRKIHGVIDLGEDQRSLASVYGGCNSGCSSNSNSNLRTYMASLVYCTPIPRFIISICVNITAKFRFTGAQPDIHKYNPLNNERVSKAV